MPSRAASVVASEPTPPSETWTAASGVSTGTMLRVLLVRLTTSSTSTGSASGAMVSAHAAASPAARRPVHARLALPIIRKFSDC
jgi:hypothetical protein